MYRHKLNFSCCVYKALFPGLLTYVDCVISTSDDTNGLLITNMYHAAAQIYKTSIRVFRAWNEGSKGKGTKVTFTTWACICRI